MENHIGRNDILNQTTGVSTSRKIGKSLHLCHPKENYFLKSLSSNPESFRDKTANAQAKQTETRKKKMTNKSIRPINPIFFNWPVLHNLVL
jgi:hypothetical protein